MIVVDVSERLDRIEAALGELAYGFSRLGPLRELPTLRTFANEHLERLRVAQAAAVERERVERAAARNGAVAR